MWPQSPPDPNKVARFEAAVVRLAGADARILLAVSGGPDSLALLILAHAAMPGQIAAATVDHGLRPEAVAEAEFVANLCTRARLPHTILRPAAPLAGNVQSAARGARYALLEAHADNLGCGWIATAHHGDDQLETLLMRLARGSGIDGLSGIRARNGRVIRPLLDFTKAELEAICADAGLEPVRDPSNDDSDFDRVAMRQWLASADHPLNVEAAARSAAALDEASQALDWMTGQLAADRLALADGEARLDAGDLPPELQRRLVLAALRSVDPQSAPRGEAMDRLLVALRSGQRVSSGNVDCTGGDIWTFRAAPPRRNG